MNNNYRMIITLLALASVLFTRPSKGQNVPSAPDLPLAAIQTRLVRLQNLRAEFDRHDVYNPDPRAEIVEGQRWGNAVMHVVKGTVDRREVFEFLEGKLRFETTLAPKSKAAVEAGVLADSNLIWAWVYSPERTEQYTRSPDGRVIGEIDPPRHLLARREFGVDVTLGLRRRNSDQWFTDTDLKKLTLKKGEGGHVVLYEDDNRDATRHMWTFDPDNGFAMTSYQEVNHKGIVCFEVVNSDFKNVDGLMLPTSSAIRVFSWQDGKRVVRESSELRITKYEVGSKDNRPDRYRMAWPANAVVVDNRSKTPSTSQRQGHTVDDQTQRRPATPQLSPRSETLPGPMNEKNATENPGRTDGQ